MDNVEQLDPSLKFMFQSELIYAGWLRDPTTRKIHGIRLVYDDGSEMVLKSTDPVWIDVVDASKSVNLSRPDLADKGGQ